MNNGTRSALFVFLFLISCLAPLNAEPEIAAESASVLTDLSPHEIMAQHGSTVVTIATVDAKGEAVRLGSGFIVNPNGVIITSASVIKDQYPIFIKLLDGEIFWDILVVHYAKEHEFAVLKVNGFQLPALTLGVTLEDQKKLNEEEQTEDHPDLVKVKAGETAVILGNPFGSEAIFSETKITGLSVPRKELGTEVKLKPIDTFQVGVSGEGFQGGGQSELPSEKVLEGYLSTEQFDANYNVEAAVYEIERVFSPEAHGGPVFNLKGQVIGVALLRTVEKQTQSYVIPINIVQPFVTEDAVMTLETLNATNPAAAARKEQIAKNAHRIREIDLIKGFYVYKDFEAMENSFVPLGRKGDYSAISYNDRYAENPKSGDTSIQFRYKKESGQTGWGAMYWQKPHWAGWEGYNLTGAHRVVFWVRGEKGGERIEEFKVGGGRETLLDSDVASAGPFTLSTEWEQHSIDLQGKDLSSINTGFYWEASLEHNPQGVTFYLDEIKFES